jgi:hypothetical protein
LKVTVTLVPVFGSRCVIVAVFCTTVFRTMLVDVEMALASEAVSPAVNGIPKAFQKSYLTAAAVPDCTVEKRRRFSAQVPWSLVWG